MTDSNFAPSSAKEQKAIAELATVFCRKEPALARERAEILGGAFVGFVAKTPDFQKIDPNTVGAWIDTTVELCSTCEEKDLLTVVEVALDRLESIASSSRRKKGLLAVLKAALGSVLTRFK